MEVWRYDSTPPDDRETEMTSTYGRHPGSLHWMRYIYRSMG